MTGFEAFCERLKKTLSALFKKSQPTEKAVLGDVGEKTALKYLTGKGYRLHKANYRHAHAEIDLIMEERDRSVVFFEVRTQDLEKEHYTTPAESISEGKKAALSRCAEYYLANAHEYYTYEDYLEAKKNNFPCRFDVIEIYTKNNKVEKINHIKDAFYKTRQKKKGRYRI